jgi:predicted acylesterase/phospholipase RssA
MKCLALGPGAMGFFLYLGVISKLKQQGRIDDLEEISGASAGGLLGFLFCVTRGDVSKCLDFALNVPVKQIMKPNIRNFLTKYGLIPSSKIRRVLVQVCQKFLKKPDVTFAELYSHFPIKLHIATYCVDLMKTVYFSVDSTPTMSVLDAVCATVAIPFLFASVKIKDWSYIDGGSAEMIPAAPFLGRLASDILGIKLAWSKLQPITDIKTYSLNILYATMRLRANYEIPILDLNLGDADVFDFGASNDSKLKMFLAGHSQG